MATYTVASKKIGAHKKTSVANTVDTVNFTDHLQSVEVFSNGLAEIYFTIDGSAPTVGGEGCYELPATPCSRVIEIPNSNERPPTAVKLISSGTPTYSVSKVGE